MNGWQQNFQMICKMADKRGGGGLYHYMVVVYTHCQHTFQFKQLVKVHVASDDPFKGLVHFQNKYFMIIYSPQCHPRCSCLSFFSQIEIKVFKENIA